MASKFSSLIETYCQARGIIVPDGFHRRAASRYAVILTNSDPPKLVAMTCFKQVDVVNYVKQYVLTGAGVGPDSPLIPARIFDFKDMVEFSFCGSARLQPLGPIA